MGNALSLDPPDYGSEIETIALTAYRGGAMNGSVAKRSVRFDRILFGFDSSDG